MSNRAQLLRHFLIVLSMLFTTVLPASVSAQDATAVASKAFPSVVEIFTIDRAGKFTGLGSGFFVLPDVIVTNYHVVDGASTIKASVVGSKDVFDIARIIKLDKENDLALLRPSSFRGTPLPLADVNKAKTGQTVFALGNPRGLEGTISQGILSGLNIREVAGTSLLQISAPISPGSSGGPVVDSSGAVLGVATLGLKDSQNLNFAVPSSLVLKIVTESLGTQLSYSGSANTPPPQNMPGGNSAGEEAYWKEVSAADTIEYYRLYLSEYPAGRYSAIAKGRINEIEQRKEEAVWQRSKSADSMAAYQEYIRLYPQGRFVSDARSGILALEKKAEERKWLEAEQIKTVDGYKGYLAAYPSGEWSALARLRLRAMGVVELGPAVGQVKSNGIGMEFAYIPPGEFLMGSNDGGSDEKPIHRVLISKAFWMGRYEVTQGQWQSVMGNNPSNFSGCGPDCPVERVSWNDAKEFLSRLNAKNDGFVYSLPTEAEWEYAARAGTTTAFAFGDSLSSTQANFDGNYPYGGAPKGPYLGKTVKVGSYQPNAWGLYDMHGNVWEWVEDWYTDSYTGLPTDGSANLTVGKKEYRVLRGGSWLDKGLYLRSADRFRVTPSGRVLFIGFRVVARQK